MHIFYMEPVETTATVKSVVQETVQAVSNVSPKNCTDRTELKKVCSVCISKEDCSRNLVTFHFISLFHFTISFHYFISLFHFTISFHYFSCSFQLFISFVHFICSFHLFIPFVHYICSFHLFISFVHFICPLHLFIPFVQFYC